jgi:hypothetical protein
MALHRAHAHTSSLFGAPDQTKQRQCPVNVHFRF